MTTIKDLAVLLRNTPSGSVQGETRAEILKILTGCWREFDGSTDSRMAHGKLGRAEDMEWNQPVLSFVVERHGAAVLGSSRAERQQWTVNLETKTANQFTIGYRQIRPTAPRLDVKPIAARVYEAVRQRPDSNSDLITQGILAWKDDQILVQHGKLIPGGGYAMTVSGRRKRFRAELKFLMATIGWELAHVGRCLTFKKR
jgi:hypothetical protein